MTSDTAVVVVVVASLALVSADVTAMVIGLWGNEMKQAEFHGGSPVTTSTEKSNHVRIGETIAIPEAPDGCGNK
jgi:hypothetical protein